MNELPIRPRRPASRYPSRIEVRATRREQQRITAQAKAVRRSVSRYLAELGTHANAVRSPLLEGQGEQYLYELKRVGMDLETLVFAARGEPGARTIPLDEVLTILRRINLLLGHIRKRWL